MQGTRSFPCCPPPGRAPDPVSQPRLGLSFDQAVIQTPHCDRRSTSVSSAPYDLYLLRLDHRA
ncbi:hypothetical protein E2C01_101316 [Portunus trituberculatus]|uniref:Uncharacterized protein n=1 Tax=Portunus trituberculatus TaxID=210409 RepID=A0A5B7KFA5_PORTR|nr:hypothetical protein [Portunus trituberculatus]